MEMDGEAMESPEGLEEVQLLCSRVWAEAAKLAVSVGAQNTHRQGGGGNDSGVNNTHPGLPLFNAGVLFEASEAFLQRALATPSSPAALSGSDSSLGDDGGEFEDLASAKATIPSDLITARSDWGREAGLQCEAAIAVLAISRAAETVGGCLRVEDVLLGGILSALMTSSTAATTPSILPAADGSPRGPPLASLGAAKAQALKVAGLLGRLGPRNL